MEMRFAERMNYLRASEIRELLKLADQPDILSFAGGMPAPELFPIDGLKEAAIKVLDDDGKAALQYGPTEGYTPLRKIIATERMLPAGVNVDESYVLVTNGSQQGLDFTGRVFLDKDDIIICESPTYLGALNAFRAYMPKFVEIPMDDKGMIMEELEKALKAYPNAKYIYTIPDFQNPTGKTLSVDRRKRLVELAREYSVPIIEDNPYGELIYEGERLPAIKSFDDTGIVIYLGTFSKTFCPGMRLGWVCAEPELLSKYILVKQGADLQPSSIAQREAAVFMKMYNLNEHIIKIRDVYKKRRDVMVNALKNELPDSCSFTYPEGGLFTWVTLPENMNARDLIVKALEEKVAFVVGGSFFANGGHENTIRLNYSYLPEEKIIEGVKRLGKVLRKELI